ncbi:hypothetical protein [Lactobacillus sp. Sy-1]|uniref:hypothetical protein n=1 Tax=Lactobacillus sp. Sy-1 TaxID=2109645 RepID=UPI001C578247|nr:hypothetical protein [Lactobacillus sp. Sy-1]MBW1605106.1 hypothetical protein [Lactobacillus sp. Sy-1]
MKSKRLLIGLLLALPLAVAPVFEGTTSVHAATTYQGQPRQFGRTKRNSRPQRMSHFNMSKKLAILSQFHNQGNANKVNRSSNPSQTNVK